MNTHDEKLQAVKEIREQQEALIRRLKKVRKYPPATTVKKAIRRAMLVLDIMQQYQSLSIQIRMIAQTPIPKYPKGAVFSAGNRAIIETAETAILPTKIKPLKNADNQSQGA